MNRYAKEIQLMDEVLIRLHPCNDHRSPADVAKD